MACVERLGHGHDGRQSSKRPTGDPVDRQAGWLAEQRKTRQSRHDLHVAGTGTPASYGTRLSFGYSNPWHQGWPMTLSLTFGIQSALPLAVLYGGSIPWDAVSIFHSFQMTGTSESTITITTRVRGRPTFRKSMNRYRPGV